MITQNIDRLHARAGTRDLVEVHGSIAHSICLVCGLRYELGDVRQRLEGDPEGMPRCDCGRPLKPGVVLFGEYLPVDAIARAETLAAGAELMLCIGSSLEVYPVAGLPETTLAAGGQIAILTQGATPFDRRAAVRMGGDVVAELEAVLAALGLGLLRPSVRRPSPEGGLEPAQRERHSLLSVAAVRRAQPAPRPRVVSRELLEALTESGRRGVAGQLRQRGVERDPDLEGRLAVAALLEVEAGAQGELLAGRALLAAGQEGGQAAVGGRDRGSGAAAARVRLARARRSTSRRLPARRRRSPGARPAHRSARRRGRGGRRWRSGTRAGPGSERPDPRQDRPRRRLSARRRRARRQAGGRRRR